MKYQRLIRYLIPLMLIGINLGCDQVSKSMVRENLELHENIQLIDQHLILTKVENSGAFLSTGEALPPLAKSLLLSLFPALTLLALMIWLFSQKELSRGLMFSLCCILGGGIGNVFDRIIHGSVTDFLHVQVGIFETGIFNFADVSITGGMLCLIVFQIIHSQKTS